MKKALMVVLGLAVLVAAAGWLLREDIALRLMANQLHKNMATSPLANLPDGLHLLVCGAGGPLPSANRSGPCLMVVAGKQVFVVDAGSNSPSIMARSGLPPGLVQAVFLTHFHSDHIDSLGELAMQRWVGGTNEQPLPVHGPAGVEQVVKGFNLAYGQDARYRIAHHGEAVVPPSGKGMVAKPFAMPPDGVLAPIYGGSGLSVYALQVDHFPIKPAVGYLFRYGGRSLLISGDTSQSQNLTKYAQGVDLLVHEALSPELVGVIHTAAVDTGNTSVAKITDDILNYHASPVQAAEVAQAAGVRHLLYYHVVPPLPLAALESVWLRGVSDAYDGPVTLPVDGTFVSLPAESDEVLVSQRL